MSYRPITDFWFLARCKYKGGIKRYGGYLGGFPERARRLIGAPITEPVLHVCGGLAHLYPYAGGYGERDERLDLDPSTKPEHMHTCTMIPHFAYRGGGGVQWAGMIADPPYSELDAEQYPPGKENYPKPNQLVERMLNQVEVGIKVGIIHYIVPTCPKNAKFIACVGIVCGFNNRIRAFSVYERTS